MSGVVNPPSMNPPVMGTGCTSYIGCTPCINNGCHWYTPDVVVFLVF
jgi:hypothetical protein